jgi:hypothetical protein
VWMCAFWDLSSFKGCPQVGHISLMVFLLKFCYLPCADIVGSLV